MQQDLGSTTSPQVDKLPDVTIPLHVMNFSLEHPGILERGFQALSWEAGFYM